MDVASLTTIQVLEGHTDTINAVAFLPESNLAVSCGVDKTARCWNLDTGKVEQQISDDNNWFFDMAVLSSRNLVALAAGDSVTLWNPKTGEVSRRLSSPGDTVMAVACSSDGHLLATGGMSKIIRIWDVASGKELRQCYGHTNDIRSLRFLSDGLRLVSGSGESYVNQMRVSKGDDTTVRLWNAMTGGEICRLPAHTAEVVALAQASERMVASGGYDKRVVVWRLPPIDETATSVCRFYLNSIVDESEFNPVPGFIPAPKLKLSPERQTKIPAKQWMVILHSEGGGSSNGWEGECPFDMAATEITADIQLRLLEEGPRRSGVGWIAIHVFVNGPEVDTHRIVVREEDIAKAIGKVLKLTVRFPTELTIRKGQTLKIGFTGEASKTLSVLAYGFSHVELTAEGSGKEVAEFHESAISYEE